MPMPTSLEIYPTFHVSFLKSYVDKKDLSKGESIRAPTTITTSKDNKVKKIKNPRMHIHIEASLLQDIRSTQFLSKPMDCPRLDTQPTLQSKTDSIFQCLVKMTTIWEMVEYPKKTHPHKGNLFSSLSPSLREKFPYLLFLYLYQKNNKTHIICQGVL